MIYRGPGYVAMPDAMYQELTSSKAAADKNRRAAMYLLGMDTAQAEGDATWYRRQP